MTAGSILSAETPLKKCCGCKARKPFDEFNKSKAGTFGLANVCRACCAAYRIKYRAANKAKLKEADRLHYKKNRERILAQASEYRAANKDAVAATKKASYEKKREHYIAMVAARRLGAGKALHAASQSKRTKRKRAEDPVYALKRRVYCCISIAFAGKRYTKNSRTHQILGCGWEEFRQHIERQFLPRMTWENRADWHLDHIVPISSAKTEEEVAALNHFTNFRPLWALDNMLKSDKRTHLI